MCHPSSRVGLVGDDPILHGAFQSVYFSGGRKEKGGVATSSSGGADSSGGRASRAAARPESAEAVPGHQ